jgi:hypothetical protein
VSFLRSESGLRQSGFDIQSGHNGGTNLRPLARLLRLGGVIYLEPTFMAFGRRALE